MVSVANWAREGIMIEDKGLKFYQDCLAKAQQQESRLLFLFLIAEETKHREALQKVLDAEHAEEAMGQFTSSAKALFDKAALKDMAPEGSALSQMLNTAMELEQQSHDFYTAEAADGPAKEFLLRLAKEELDHLELIRSFGFNLVGIGIPLR